MSPKLIGFPDGLMNAQQVASAINNPNDIHGARTRLVEVENTSNKGGGTVYQLSDLKTIGEVAKNHNLGYHLDGARLWNALVTKQETTKDYGQLFDTISVCLSKGLGCPIGSVLIGNNNLMKNAIRVRKIFGGNMRQVGYLAAAGLYALDHNIERLKEDHKKAKEIGKSLSKLSFIKKVEPVETNIVIFELESHIDETTFVKKLTDKNIHIIGMGGGKLRIVTHLDYTNEMHDYFLSTIKNLNSNRLLI